MNKETAVQFLKAHQPMPDDSELTENLMEQYDEVRTFLQENPIDECLTLILNSFGEYSGMGVYQLVEDTVAEYPYEKVVSALGEALQSPYNGVKYWCAQIAMNFPDKKLTAPLSALLDDEYCDIRSSAILALSCIQEENVLPILKNRLAKEDDEQIKQLLTDTINDFKTK